MCAYLKHYIGAIIAGNLLGIQFCRDMNQDHHDGGGGSDRAQLLRTELRSGFLSIHPGSGAIVPLCCWDEAVLARKVAHSFMVQQRREWMGPVVASMWQAAAKAAAGIPDASGDSLLLEVTDLMRSLWRRLTAPRGEGNGIRMLQ